MMEQNKKHLRLIYSILLFLVLSLFTVYPHIDILKYRSETVIDNNAKDRKYISSYQLDKNNYISTTININNKIKSLVFRIDTSKIKDNIQIELSQGSRNKIYNIGPSKDINKIINIDSNQFKAGKLNIKITNTSDNNISYIINYPNQTSGYIKLNGKQDVNAFSIYLKTIYSGSDFLLVSWIVFILILLIQGYISYIVFAKELQDNRVYWLSALLFLLVCILRFPLFTFWAEPFAETMTLYVRYNLDKTFSLIDMLFLKDYSMTYLSSFINIIGRVLGLDKYLVVYLYMSGIIIACLWLALFTRISLRKYFPDYVRLIITFSLLGLWNGQAFYINSMFTYWGIYFIIFMYLIDLDKISRLKYILGMFLIFLIVNNKMSYIFLVPSAFLMIFYYGLQNKRKLYMQIVIIISCFMNYIVYSILTPSERSRGSGMIERIFDIDTGIIKMLDGIASVINLQILFPKYTQIFSLFILLILISYCIYVIVKNKNIKNSGYILFVILVAVFMSQYIHIVSMHVISIHDVNLLMANFNDFTYLKPGLRRYYMLYFSVYMLIIFIIWIIYNKNNNYSIVLISIIILLSIQLQNITQQHNELKFNSSKNMYNKYYVYMKQEIFSIPIAPVEWHNSKNAYQNAYSYENGKYSLLNGKTWSNSKNACQKIEKSEQILSNKCIISLHVNYADIQYSQGKVTANFYDKNGNLISEHKQLNKSNYYIPTGSFMSFMFKEPVCNIDRIEFTDEENKPVWITGRIILGIVK